LPYKFNKEKKHYQLIRHNLIEESNFSADAVPFIRATTYE